jgi:hypothetical protein
MSSPPTRPCPQCKAPVPTGETRCPQCGADLAIITRPIEALPPDTEPEPVGLEPVPGELLPADDQGIGLKGGVKRSFSVSTSVTTSTSRIGGTGHAHVEVKLDLSQALIDPDSRLAPTAYYKLMHRWSEALGREMQSATEGGQTLETAEAARRVPLPFGPDCGGDLPVAVRDAMTERAQRQVAQLPHLPTPAEVFGPHAGPGGDSPLRELIEATNRADRARRPGLTITCGSLLAGAGLCAAVGLGLVWWICAS